MENQIRLFENQAFGKIRVIMRDSEPWFIARDVALALGYENISRDVQRHCKYVELFKSTVSVLLEDNPRGILIIPESDIYRLIMRSNMPKAVEFQDWVMEEILPSIRKTGQYGVPDYSKFLADPKALIATLTALDEERERSAALEAQNDELVALNESYKNEFWRAHNNSVFYNSFATCRAAIDTNTAGILIRQQCGIPMGGKRLRKWMRTHGWMRKKNTFPTQMAIDKGYLQLGINAYANGPAYRQILVTPKGQDTLINIFLEGTLYR